ncbi:hypothetical protein V8C86DRAFT_2970556 [Haematococcus lacustris]
MFSLGILACEVGCPQLGTTMMTLLHIHSSCFAAAWCMELLYVARIRPNVTTASSHFGIDVWVFACCSSVHSPTHACKV